MKKLNNCSLQTLIGIHNYSIIIGFILILVGFFTMPAGIVCLLIGIFLIGIGIYANKLINQKQNRPSELIPESSDLGYKNSLNAQSNLNTSFNLPYVKKCKTDISEANRRLKQLDESYKMVRKTTEVETFFRRLHFCFDCTLDLMGYKIKFAKNATPEVQYIQFKKDLREIVDDFIVRSYNNEIEKCASLKTEKAKKNRMDKYFEKMYNAFENADSFWSGNSGYMHYVGALYVPENIDHLKRLHAKHIPIDVLQKIN